MTAIVIGSFWRPIWRAWQYIFLLVHENVGECVWTREDNLGEIILDTHRTVDLCIALLVWIEWIDSVPLSHLGSFQGSHSQAFSFTAHTHNQPTREREHKKKKKTYRIPLYWNLHKSQTSSISSLRAMHIMHSSPILCHSDNLNQIPCCVVEDPRTRRSRPSRFTYSFDIQSSD